MPGDPFYRSKEWVKIRNKVRTKWQRDGKPCPICSRPIVLGERTIVDHTVPRKVAPHRAFDESNLVLCHHSCHNTKTHRHDKLNVQAIGNDGMPKDSEWA